MITYCVDLMGMITKTWNNETNTWDRWLLTKATPTISAGSRIKFLAEKIPFGYKYLEEAIANAISEAQAHGASVISGPVTTTTEQVDYNALRAEAQDLWVKLVGSGENADEDMARRIMKRVEMIFGHPIKLSEIQEDQSDLFNLVILDMRDLAAEKLA